MFKRLDIMLTEEICSCEKKENAWSIDYSNITKGKFGLKLFCKKCKTTITVPYDKLVARIVVDGDKKEVDSKKDISKVDIQPKQVSIDSGKPPWAKD